jgi:hypothetical protein
MMAKTFFDMVYGATADAKKAMKKPFVKNKVNRALDGAADSYEQEKIDVQECIDSLYDQLINGDTSAIDSLIEAELALVELDTQAAVAKQIKEKLASPAKEEKE